MKNFKNSFDELALQANFKINNTPSHEVIKAANENNINCYKAGKVYKFAFMEDLNYILTTDLFTLADAI